ALAGERFEVGSAGTEKTRVNPLAIRVMAEKSIDISGHTSKRYEDVTPPPWDYLITGCDDANERCPFVRGPVKRLRWSFEDPSRAQGDEAQRLAVFRRVRDQIHERLVAWLKEPAP